MVDIVQGKRDARGEWKPKGLPGPTPPFRLPFNPKAILQWLFSEHIFYVLKMTVLAVVVWYFLTPNLDQMQTLKVGPVVLIFLRNVALLMVYAGRLHWRLYVRKTQDMKYKYTNRWPATKDSRFLFGNQTWDNMFWSIGSGGTIWTLYEVLLLWAYGHGFLPFASLRSNPLWHLAFFAVLPFWQDFHFYFVHRISHWKPIYKAAHYLHHRNTNVGPWSGLSMHPIEHLLYFTRWIILLVVPSHPIHMLYLMQRPAIRPAIGHSGFDQLVLKKISDKRFAIDSYFHYLHHRHFECNYGASGMPFDRWFGSFHDGSRQSYEHMRSKRQLPAEGTIVDGR